MLGREETLTAEALASLKDQLINGHFYDSLREFGYNLYQYIIGSLAFGFIFGIAVGIVSYLLLVLFRKKNISA